MITRPWPIKILFLAHVFAPLFNILMSAMMSGGTPQQYINYKISTGSHLELIAMMALLPIAGIVIFACKRWSYFAYLLLMALVFAFNVMAWQKNPQLFNLSYLIAFFVINFSVVGYFLIPSVRTVYFNQRLRWWESEPRYIVGLSGQILANDEDLTCKIANISRSGARITTTKELGADKKIKLRFTFEEQSFEVLAIVRNYNNGEHGLEFLHNDESRKKLRHVIRTAFAKQFERRTPPPPILKSFFDWFYTLITTGKGLIPDVPSAKNNKKLSKK